MESGRQVRILCDTIVLWDDTAALVGVSREGVVLRQLVGIRDVRMYVFTITYVLYTRYIQKAWGITNAHIYERGVQLPGMYVSIVMQYKQTCGTIRN